MSIKCQKDIRMEEWKGKLLVKLHMSSKLIRQTGFELPVLESVIGPLYASVIEEKNPTFFFFFFDTYCSSLETGFLELSVLMASKPFLLSDPCLALPATPL